jgi:hypothetical protein
MHLRRGISPVLYHLYYDDFEVGRLRRTPEATIAVSFGGFGSAAAAASAAWLAYSGRLAYEAQFAPFANDGSERFPEAHRRRVANADDRELVTRHDGDTTRLLLDGEEIARLLPPSTANGFAGWSIELALGPVDTPVVFALAAARRMWEAIRRAGSSRGMTQWSPEPDLAAKGAGDDAPLAG